MAKFEINNFTPKWRRPTTFIPQGDKEINDFELSDDKIIGALGNPVFANLVFDAKTYKYGVTDFDFPGLTINSVLISVNQNKNIVKTSIQGRNGTIKEYIADGDFSISVNGTITTDDPFNYPTERVQNLIKILNVPTEIDVTSEFLNRFGITSVVVDSYSIPQQSGSRNIQPFSISMSSDGALEIGVKEYEPERSTTINAKFRL